MNIADDSQQLHINKTPSNYRMDELLKSDTCRSEEKYLQSLATMTQRGRIELIMGPMFAGKSTELLRRVNRLEISGKRCLSIKYSADNRYS
jgi:ABC-type polar amino acid transport system ATPase subunit